MMFKNIILLIIILIAEQSFAQREKMELYGGIGVGRESALVFPKIGVLSKNYDNRLNTYWGADFGIWFFFANFGSVTAHVGTENDWFLFEFSSGVWHLPKPDHSGVDLPSMTQISITPKVGFKFAKNRLKFGTVLPVYFDRGNLNFEPLTFFKYKKVSLNLEYIVMIDFEDHYMNPRFPYY